MSTCGYCGIMPICPDCRICHNCVKGSAKSQKANAILANLVEGVARHLVFPATCSLVANFWPSIRNSLPVPEGKALFARPCPTRPRHGFVESRKVTSPEEYEQVRLETLAADPEGEILLSAWIDADWNAIYTPGLITIGKGHDGATSGTGEGVIRIPTVPMKWADDQTRKAMGIAAGEVPYVEAVGQDGKRMIITQIRSGPEVASINPNYIPFPVTVREVITFDPALSLLDWEKLMEASQGKEGLVVYHPKGSVTDHASVHARSRKIPLVTFPVTVGMMIEPGPETAPPPHDPLQVLRGIKLADRWEWLGSELDSMTNLSLFALHHESVLRGELSMWLGIGAASLLRLGSLALRGEARHEHTLRKKGAKPDRTSVYLRHANRSLTFHRASVVRLMNNFRYGNFGSPTVCAVGGIGGINWSYCANSLIPLFNAVKRLDQERNEDAVGELIRAYNCAINQAHNGGWWLNKFTDSNAFDQIPQGWPTAMVQVVQAVTEGLRLTVEADVSYADWPTTALYTPKVKSVRFIQQPNGMGLHVKFKGILARERIIPVPLTSILPYITSVIKVQSNEGLLEVVAANRRTRKAGTKSTEADRDVLWAEQPPRVVWKNKG